MNVSAGRAARARRLCANKGGARPAQIGDAVALRHRRETDASRLRKWEESVETARCAACKRKDPERLWLVGRGGVLCRG